MQTTSEFGKRVRRLEQLLAGQLGLTSGDLATRVSRARRSLPKSVKRDLMTVAQAAHLVGHPRIAPQINRTKVDEAYRRAVAHLRSPQMSDIRKGRRMGAVGALVFNLLVVFAAVLGVMILRDII